MRVSGLSTTSSRLDLPARVLASSTEYMKYNDSLRTHTRAASTIIHIERDTYQKAQDQKRPSLATIRMTRHETGKQKQTHVYIWRENERVKSPIQKVNLCIVPNGDSSATMVDVSHPFQSHPCTYVFLSCRQARYKHSRNKSEKRLEKTFHRSKINPSRVFILIFVSTFGGWRAGAGELSKLP